MRTPDQQSAFNCAVHIYSEATGIPCAACVETLDKKPGLLGVIATALREMAGVSPLADELDRMFPKPAPAEKHDPKEPKDKP